MQVSVTVFDVRENRREWKETIKPEMVEHLVFLDESGVNTNLTRLYGRAPSSRRAVDHAPLNTPQTTTVLSSIRLDGEKAFTTYQGGTTGERFVQYLKETLLPTLRQGDIVVMDNMRSHHVKAVREILEAKGMKVLYLPPYSLDLNPIEKMWSKMNLRYVLLKNPEHLSENQQAQLLFLTKANPKLYRAYLLKENLRLALKAGPDEIAGKLSKWMAWAQRCRIPVFRDLRKKIKRHFDAIVAAARFSLSNARAEAFNNKIKLIIRTAFGFRNVDNLLAMVMLSCSLLHPTLPHR